MEVLISLRRGMRVRDVAVSEITAQSMQTRCEEILSLQGYKQAYDRIWLREEMVACITRETRGRSSRGGRRFFVVSYWKA